MTPFAQATPSQIAAHQARQERMGLWSRQEPKALALDRPTRISPIVRARIEAEKARIEALKHPAPVVLIGPPSWRVILELVALKHRLDPADILKTKRHRAYVEARDELNYLLRGHMKLSLSQIARLTGDRHHTTILQSIRKYAHRHGVPVPWAPVRRNPPIKIQVAQMYAQHPTWTARMIADALDIRLTTSATWLSNARAMAAALSAQGKAVGNGGDQ